MLVDTLKRRAYVEFDCKPKFTYSSGKIIIHRSRKSRHVEKGVDVFAGLMQSNSPPKTKEELIHKASLEFGIIAWWLVRHLIIKVLIWCWNTCYPENTTPSEMILRG